MTNSRNDAFTHIVKETIETGRAEVLDFDDQAIARIATYNGGTPDQVRAWLMDGHWVYTNFSRYRIERLGVRNDA